MVTHAKLNLLLLHYEDLDASLIPEIISNCDNPHNWHKFVIANIETYDRNYLLKTIVDFVYPCDLIPVQFTQKNVVHFMARNCLDAILKLVANSLKVPNPMCPDKPLKLIIIANHLPAEELKIDLKENINHILRKRLNESTRALDLKNFHNDPDLQEFCALSQPKLMRYILYFAAKLSPKELDLRNNFIKTVEPISLMSDCDIEVIDLRNNEIASMDDLEPLRDLKKLKILSLNGNPLCDHYDKNSYVSQLLKISPSVQSLDSTKVKDYITSEYRFPNTVKNFLCSYDGGDLVNQFVEYYFSLYDLNKRKQLHNVYHENATFSVTARMIPNQKSCSGAVLGHFRSISRNLHSYISGFSDNNTFLFKGRSKILNLLSNLPYTHHDPLLLHCDLIYYERNIAILTVQGVFQEETRQLGFTRNFVLKREEDSFLIINELLHVYNALDSQIEQFDRFPPNVQFSYNPLPYFHHQYQEVEEALHVITNMNLDYSQKFLEQNHYDFTVTLHKFIELYINDEIPEEAFINSGNEREKSDPSSKEENFLFASNLAAKTLDKYPQVSAKTVWSTLNNERIAASIKSTIGNEGKTLSKQKKLPLDSSKVSKESVAKPNQKRIVKPVKFTIGKGKDANSVKSTIDKAKETLSNQNKSPLNMNSSSKVSKESVAEPLQNITFPIDPLPANQKARHPVNSRSESPQLIVHPITDVNQLFWFNQSQQNKDEVLSINKRKRKKRKNAQGGEALLPVSIKQQDDNVPVPELLHEATHETLPVESLKQEANEYFNQQVISEQSQISANGTQSSLSGKEFKRKIEREPEPSTGSAPPTKKLFQPDARLRELGALLENRGCFMELPEEIKQKVLEYRPKNVPENKGFRFRLLDSSGRLYRYRTPRPDKLAIWEKKKKED